MTIAEAERFYEQDTKKYEIEKNKDFLNWYKDIISKGYHPFMKTNELQQLIDNIVNWYELKYPEKELEYFEGISHTKFKDIKSISNVMTLRQLLFRLSNKQNFLMECGYRAKGGKQYPYICIHISKKNINKNDFNEIPYYIIEANCINGKVLNAYELDEYLNSKKNFDLNKLLSRLNKYSDKLDLTELKESIFDYKCDNELRNKVLQLAALKLLYSKNTIPNRGYERAKRFINEFNKNLSLTLSIEEIDEIIQRDYNNEDSEDKKTSNQKKLIKNF